jgi:hypothetical protein
MYVMNAFPPAQQSLAGGIFNTIVKTSSAVGLGISASIYNAESSTSSSSGGALQTGIRPYKMVWWFCVASAGLSLFFVPFLSIKTQGHSEESSVQDLDEKQAASETDKNGEKEDQVTDLPSMALKE